MKNEILRNLRLIVFDFDGVFTDNRVIINETGRESVICTRADGIGIDRLRQLGIDCMILSTETNLVVRKRADKLKLDCVHGCDDKLEQLIEEAERRTLTMDAVAFVGNDINDLSCLKAVGFPVVVADAEAEVLPYAQYITSRKGGHGAVREVCDLIYHAISGEK